MSRPPRLLALGAIVLALLLGRVAAPALIGDVLVSASLRSPALLSLPLLGDIVVERLGDRISAPAGSDTTLVTVEIAAGSSSSEIAAQLFEAGLIGDETGFIVAVSRAGLEGGLQAGLFQVAASMTPSEIALALTQPYREPAIAVQLRAGLRLEQIVAQIGTLDLPFTQRELLDLLRTPSAEILADYDWLDLPTGSTLEGRLGAGTFNVPVSATAERFVRMLLDRFAEEVPAELRGSAPDGRSFHEVLTMASIVEREAALDEERPRMAGVYAYRLQQGIGLFADPTIIWVADSAALRNLKVEKWQTYEFWTFPEQPYVGLVPPRVPKDLVPWNTFVRGGLPPTPICSPSRASIEAALAPDTSRKEMYFVLIPGANGRHDFSQTLAEHEAKARKYGWK
ncbi:MAG: endolytic transglycosylase MltG [Chloroflexi bacterium]|nr:MAG: endolytic transglycosylase MltG [Chloroflexota bacterium]